MSSKRRHAEALARMFRVLGDRTRIALLMTLQEGEHNVTQMCKKLRIPQPTVSRHLGILRAAGLVKTRRDGKEIHYSLDGMRLTVAPEE